jgi:hypothetical protein
MSLRKAYSSSRLHLRRKKSTISARPLRNSPRFRHTESSVYALATRSWVSGVPGVLRCMNLLTSGLLCERRERWSLRHGFLLDMIVRAYPGTVSRHTLATLSQCL